MANRRFIVPTGVLGGPLTTYYHTDTLLLLPSIGDQTVEALTIRRPRHLRDAAIPVRISCRNATGGGGTGVEVQLSQGDSGPKRTRATVPITASDQCWLWVDQSDNTTEDVTGYIEVESGAEAAPPDVALTTLVRVKDYLKKTGSDDDDFLTQLIGDVSQTFATETLRHFIAEAITEERIRGNGIDAHLVLSRRPVTAIDEVRAADGSIVDAAGYYLLSEESGILVAKDSDGAEIPWLDQPYSIDYATGFAAIPWDLVLAADKQVAHEWHLSPRGGGRLGTRGSILDGGGSAQFLTGPWAQGVKPILDHYRDPRIFR